MVFLASCGGLSESQVLILWFGKLTILSFVEGSKGVTSGREAAFIAFM